MKNNPIQMMLDEHEFIMEAIDQALEMENSWEHEPETYKLRAQALVKFFKEYADGFHHRKEEDMFFPAVKQHPDFTLPELIDEFAQHHEDFREYARDIRESLAGNDLAGSFKTLKAYCNDLADHIAAENDELFVMAESLFSDDELETLFFRFQDADMELGTDRKRSFEQNIGTWWP